MNSFRLVSFYLAKHENPWPAESQEDVYMAAIYIDRYKHYTFHSQCINAVPVAKQTKTPVRGSKKFDINADCAFYLQLAGIKG